MKKDETKKLVEKVSKLACGKALEIPEYGTVRAYRDLNGKRKFSLSGSQWFCNGGNLTLAIVKDDLKRLQQQ